MEQVEMKMDIENHNIQIEQYLDETAAEFDRIVEAGQRKRRRIIRWSALTGAAVAASIALLLWIPLRRPSSGTPLTPIQIAEGIRQIGLLDLGDIESITATPMETHAILTARLKDGSTCSYILQFDEKEGTPTLLAYQPNE